AVEGDPEEEGEGEEADEAPRRPREPRGEEAARRAHPVDQGGGRRGEHRRQDDPQLSDPLRLGVERHQPLLFCRKLRSMRSDVLRRGMRRLRAWMAVTSSWGRISPRSSRRWRSISKLSWSRSEGPMVFNVRSVTRVYPPAMSRAMA